MKLEMDTGYSFSEYCIFSPFYQKDLWLYFFKILITKIFYKIDLQETTLKGQRTNFELSRSSSCVWYTDASGCYGTPQILISDFVNFSDSQE